MTFTPTGNRILVELVTGENKSINGIHIPDAHRDTSTSEGVVAGLGTKGPFDVKVGDRVVINRYIGIDVKIAGKMFKMLEMSEILAVIE
jgi:chaperonin GroES